MKGDKKLVEVGQLSSKWVRKIEKFGRTDKRW